MKSKEKSKFIPRRCCGHLDIHPSILFLLLSPCHAGAGAYVQQSMGRRQGTPGQVASLSQDTHINVVKLEVCLFQCNHTYFNIEL